MHQNRSSHHFCKSVPRWFVCGLATVAVASVGGLGVPGAPALAEDCANAALRAENDSTRLPECRAYELVTPAYKEGYPPFLSTYTDDGAFAFTSVGNFAENGVDQAVSSNQYVATRSATGWKTSAPAPGPTYAAGAGVPVAMSADLRSSIWELRRSEQPANVGDAYLRGPDGSFSRIGPSVNPVTLPPEPPGPVYDGPHIDYPLGASADLSHLLFYADPAVGDFGPAVLYEYVGTGNDHPRAVGLDNAGQLVSADGAGYAGGMSSDGRVIFFIPAGTGQLWARINGTTSIDASASECTRTAGDPGGACGPPAAANYVGEASDGSRVLFTTTQQLVNSDTDETNDLYACDIPPGTPAPVGLVNPCASLNEVPGGASGAGFENVVRISEDGARVYFVAQGVLAANRGAGDAEGTAGDHVKAVAGDNNLYVWEKDASHPTGQTTFVTKLSVNDLGGAQTTTDGRYLVFTTANQLLASDTDEGYDVYRYDAATGTLLRLSTDTSGSGGNTPGFNTEISGVTPKRARSAISSDGSTVVFTTSEALSPADSNGTVDVYEWHDGQVSLISSGRPSPPAILQFAVIDASGTDIYFNTPAQLTPSDVDTNEDMYDARVEGGFGFTKATPCTGEGCAPAIASPPSAPAAGGSSTFNGPGNLTTSLPSAPAPGPKPLTRAQKLAKALQACKSKHNKKKRNECQKRARRSYGSSK